MGYPYGLRGDDIPLAARIVHVADAFDAMTSARAYRSGRIPVEAIAELRRCVGTDFDGPAVEALIAALPRLVAASEPLMESTVDAHWVSARKRSSSGVRREPTVDTIH
jgi:HD-GYP domain-containing protein (c-di-GMP phosphodiesterase class II)